MAKKSQPLTIQSRNPNVRAEFRKARISKGKTQKDMAHDLGLKQSYVRFVENNHVKPSLKKMLLFELYFGVPSQKLFPDIYKEALGQTKMLS